jgi:uncharacterized protein DUF4260
MSWSMPRAFLHLEGATLLALGLGAYAHYDESWLMFVLLFFVPDVGVLGYLVNARLGAVTYNLTHSYPGPAIVMAAGLAADSGLVISLGLIWFAHVSFDRMLGFGLKYPSRFGDTHYQHV